MKKNKIKELFNDSKTVYIFDVDGVLTTLEFGEYNHYELNDEEWAKSLALEDAYANCRPIKKIQEFIKERQLDNIYVATKVMNEIEFKQKKEFLKKYYNILEDHIYLVYNNEDKLKVINKIKKCYPNLEDKYFVMIDDTVEVLNNIMENSSFSTVHISSFLE